MKSNKLWQRVVAFSSGLLLGVGLLISGMTDPQKVLGFLDVFGEFDPSLMFVMLGAIGVHMLAYRFKERYTTQPSFSEVYVLPVRRELDAKLVVGALLFGLGWGLGGYCPGPAITSLASGGASVLVFVLAMSVGMFVTAKLEGRFSNPHAQPKSPAASIARLGGAQKQLGHESG